MVLIPPKLHYSAFISVISIIPTMSYTIYFVDAFTQQLFAGNTAAVLITEQWLDDRLMQNIAAENNLSETAFIVPNDDDNFAIRWFSPLCEIDFCGHASLAAASVIFEEYGKQHIVLTTNTVGTLSIQKEPSGRICMTFPRREALKPNTIPDDLLHALNVQPEHILKSPQAWFAIYQNEAQIKACKPDLDKLKKLAPLDLVVTAPASSSDKYDFVSRYFWPANGGDEDPVTGSIHAGLAPYWASRLNKTSLTAHQVSTRGGVLYCDVTESDVVVSGYTKRYLIGQINIV